MFSLGYVVVKNLLLLLCQPWFITQLPVLTTHRLSSLVK